jgi:hypothetical protein
MSPTWSKISWALRSGPGRAVTAAVPGGLRRLLGRSVVALVTEALARSYRQTANERKSVIG